MVVIIIITIVILMIALVIKVHLHGNRAKTGIQYVMVIRGDIEYVRSWLLGKSLFPPETRTEVAQHMLRV